METRAVAVLIPFNSDEPYRLRALEHVKAHYESLGLEVVIGTDGMNREGWIKALAVRNALEQTSADVLVIADADCITLGLEPALNAVLSRSHAWAVPHSSTRRLSPEATTQALAGEPLSEDLKLAGKCYSSVPGGGITVITREAYLDVPIDPRFHTTHGEDVAWASALVTLIGKPFRTKADMYHLWHPPIPAMGIKYDLNSNLARIYARVKGYPNRMRAVIEEAKAWQPTPALAVVNSGKTCAVIVPVLRRPASAQRFMDSFKLTNSDACVYAVADSDDYETIQAWRDNDATVLITDRGSRFGQKANYGFEGTSEPWLLFVGDDVVFHEGWLDAALTAAGDSYNVVSTNDLGRDDLDRLAIHPFMRRSYIENVGSSWDGPGVVAHEGYTHWQVDVEWSQVARDRNTLTYASDCVIEHMHPLWGKGEADDTYRLGQRNARRDRALYDSRYRLARRRVRT